MRKLIPLLILFTIVGCKSQQVESTMWENSKNKLPQSKDLPSSFKQYDLQKELFASQLDACGNQKTAGNTVSIPDPDGNMSEFIIWKSSVANQTLVDKYPNLQTYQGVSKQSDAIRIRVENSEKGIQAMVLGGEDTWYITPVVNFPDTYMIYYKKDLPIGVKSFWSDKVIQENE